MSNEDERTPDEVQLLTELETVDRSLRELARHKADVMKEFKESRATMVEERNGILDALDDIKLGNRDLFTEGVKVEPSTGDPMNAALEDLVNNNVSILLDRERQDEIDEEDREKEFASY